MKKEIPEIEYHLSDTDVKTYEQEGYLVLENLLSLDEITRLRKEVMDTMQVLNLADTTVKLKQTHQYVKDLALDGMINSEKIRELASRLMRGASHLYLPFTAVKSAGGGGVFDFHQDGQYTPTRGPGLNVWIALDDMSTENGCLHVTPRSHINGVLPSSSVQDGHKKTTYEIDAAVPIHIKAGDCIVFNRLTVHGSGKNSTEKHRVAYALQYMRNDTMTYQNEVWSLNNENPIFKNTTAVDRIRLEE